MRRLVIIEDETVLRSSLVRGLGSLSNLEVVGAGDFQGGLDLIDEKTPDMILSDIDLPDRLGIELIGELAIRKLQIPVIFMSGYLKAYGAQIPRHANVDVLEKPVALQELRQIVKERISIDDGSSSPFSVADYLQLACMGKHSVRIFIEDNSGEVLVVNGELWSARDEQGEGTDAFRRMAFMEWHGVSCETLQNTAVARSIHENWQGLLLDTAKKIDEGEFPKGFSSNSEPSSPSALDLLPPPALLVDVQAAVAKKEGHTFESLLNSATEAILDRNYEEALSLLTKAKKLKPDDAHVQINLDRLAKLGYSSKTSEGIEP